MVKAPRDSNEGTPWLNFGEEIPKKEGPGYPPFTREAF